MKILIDSLEKNEKEISEQYLNLFLAISLGPDLN